VAQKEAHCKSQSKYRKSKKGRETNKNGAKRRRIKKNEKSVADRGAISPQSDDILHPIQSTEKPRCLICGVSGRVVTRFPRRGYSSTQSMRLKIPQTGGNYG